MDPPSKDEGFDKDITFYHPRIGQRKFQANNQQILAELKTSLQSNSQLYLFMNYYFEYKGKKLSFYEPIGSMIAQKDIKIDILFSPFEYKTAQFHVLKSMECIFNPEYYLYLYKFDKQPVHIESQFQQIPKQISVQIENLKPDLSHPFLNSPNQSNRKYSLVSSFTLSGFNPAPMSERLSGDLFYLFIRSLEGQDFHITASPSGFYVNQSKTTSFNPAKSTIYKGVFGSLIDLLKAISQKFKENLQYYLSEYKITQRVKYKFCSGQRLTKRKNWIQNPENEHGWGQRKSGIDQHLEAELYNLKDWNQIFQLEYQMNNTIKTNRIQRSAQLAKTYAKFEIAAREGATFIIDGKIAPLNPTDEKKKHIYIYNKIFFSIANESVYDHSQEKGEDATPSSSSINTDLINIEKLYNLGLPDLHVLHMVVVNYRGYKVIAQCIIPGILSIDQINCSQYGSIDDGKTIQTNPEFQKIMVQVCQKVGIQDFIEVIDGNNEKKRIAGSPDIKGILGSDKRKYILDLLRLSPRDLNYEGIENQTCVLRPQLIKNYRKVKGNQKLRFNVNIGTQIKFEKPESYESQLHLLQDIAQYLRKTAIINLIETLKNHPSQYLTNNEGIGKAFHFWGVNMRYLGEVYSHEKLKNQKAIKLVLERVIFIRSVKHLLRMAMRQSNILHLGGTIINILNSLFGKKSQVISLEEGIAQNEENGEKNTEKDVKKKKKKKNNNKQMAEVMSQLDLTQIVNVIKIPTNKFYSMKPSEIWDQVRKISEARFKHSLPKSQFEFQPFKFPFQKIATLRDVCLCVGLVLQKKNYDIFQSTLSNSNDKNLPFNVKNIIAIEPSIKKMKIQPQNLMEREKESEQLISSYQVKEALKLDNSLEKENNSISGGLNQTAIKLYTRMSRILYILTEFKSAILQQEKNISMLQSLHIQDHSLNIQSHINLGLYYISQNDKSKVVYYMAKGIYLMLITFGQTSPDLLVSFANLAKIYQMNKEYKEAIKCYKAAMKFIEQIHGKYHVIMSFCFASLATIGYQMGDIKSAIEYQTQNVGILLNVKSILLQILPETDSKLQDAQKILKIYKQMYQKAELQNSLLNLGKVEVKKKMEDDMKKKGKKN